MTVQTQTEPGQTQTEPGQTQTRPMDEAQHSRRWLILGVLALAQLMVVLDATVVNIALPRAQGALHFSNADRQWIVTAYSLAFGSFLLLGGRLSDLFGRRRALVLGMIGFAGMSAIGGAATSYVMLVVARAGQGLFGALLAPAALASLSTTFTDPDERGKAFGIYGAVAGTGAAIGLLVGGTLTQFLSWRWCLYVNIVIAVIAVTGALLLMKRESSTNKVRLDLPGTVTVTAGLVSIVYGLSEADTSGWSSPLTLALLAAGVGLLAVFAVIETRVASPLLPLRVLLHRNRGATFAAFALIGAGTFGVFLFLTYYMERTLAYSPVLTGVAFLPLVGGMLVSANLSTSVIVPRLGVRFAVTSGMTISAVSMAWMTQLGVHTSYLTHALPPLILAGVGMGLVFAPGMETATSGVGDHDAGVASAMVNVAQQVGGSIGTALLNTIATSAAATYIATHGGGTQALSRAAVHSYSVAFWWVAVLFAAGAVLTAVVMRRPSADEEAEPRRADLIAG